MLPFRRGVVRAFLALVVLGLMAWCSDASGAADKNPQSADKKPSATKKTSTKSAASKTTRKTSAKKRRPRRESYRSRLARLKPQPQRVQEIQQALAASGHLGQEPNGKWDNATRDAMRRFQEDHGFPATGLPEAKALMKLGLGPHPLPKELDPTARGHADVALPEVTAAPSEQAPPSDQMKTE